jgi:hypothetical protein
MKASKAHLGTAGDNIGESGDNAKGGAVENGGESFDRRSYQLDEIQLEAFNDAASVGGDDERREAVLAFWRAAGDRMGFNPVTVEQAADIEDSGAFTAYPNESVLEPAAGGPPIDPATAMDRLERTLEGALFNTRSMVFDVRDAVLEFIKRMPKPWGITPFDQQQDIAAAAEQFGRDLVRQIVEAVVVDDRTAIRALLVKYDEADDIKVTLKVKALGTDELEAAVVGLHRARGKHVMITVASADDYAEDRRDAELQPDQPGLHFEAGSDDHPDDDRDLAKEEEQQQDA